MEENTPASLSELTLSAALLTPLNTIFEAQVHAARSFLNFILQMGFRHKYTNGDIKELVKGIPGSEIKRILEVPGRSKTDVKDIISDLKTSRSTGQAEMQTGEGKDVVEDLSNDELTKIKDLLNEGDDFYALEFDYIDDSRNKHRISIPHLALIPVRPLTIDTASFNFEMGVSKSADFKTIRASANAENDRPWYLIKPKQFIGNIISKEQATKQASISITINIKNAEMPAGLNKFITSVTESSRIKRVDE